MLVVTSVTHCPKVHKDCMFLTHDHSCKSSESFRVRSGSARVVGSKGESTVGNLVPELGRGFRVVQCVWSKQFRERQPSPFKVQLSTKLQRLLPSPALRPAQAGVAAPAGSAPLVESATESAPHDKGADWELNSHAARTLNTRGKQCQLAKIVTKTAAALDSTSGALPFSDDFVATS